MKGNDMTINGLWPNDFKVVQGENTPEDILNVQAQDLGRKTKHLLEGRVERSSQGEWLTLDFYITVPSVDHYSYQLLKVRHKVPPYPVEIIVSGMSKAGPVRMSAKTRKSLEFHLKVIFTSPAIRKVVEELLSYARQAASK
jgi:hypothetical protein